MLPWLMRFLNRFRPREGWGILFLAWIAVVSLSAAAIDGRQVRGLEPTLWLATLGLLAGWWLAGRRLRGLVAAVVATSVGLIADLIWGVHALAIWPLVRQTARWLVWWVGKRSGLAPGWSYFADQWASMAGFGRRVGWWVQGVITGQGVIDNLVLIGLAGLLAWCIAAWAGWWLARHGRPFVALLPTGVLLAQQVYVAEAGTVWLLVFLGSTTLLLAQIRLEWLMQLWEAAGTDYSPEIRLESALVGFVIALLVVGMSPVIPVPSIRSVSNAFWRVFEQPYRQFEDRLEASFPGVRPGRSLVPPAGVATGGLPRAHLLGGRPELGDEVALRVRVHGAQVNELLYWRGQTFARYNGHGWEADVSTIRQDFAAGEPWQTTSSLAGRHPVLSIVEVIGASRSVLYAAGEPVSADRPYRAVLRAPGELIALQVANAPTRYVVLGEAADGDPGNLRAAGTAYPPEISSSYLQLPDDLPAGLTSYAAEITVDAETPYDRALAIEAALRQIPYSLDVPPPPADREVVSWFLNDLQRGYCDYYATAMVVLARLSGIPARLAVGYAMGGYDSRSDAYVVTELQAHSWPELYFPEYGWVPFEPTAARPLPARLAVPQALPAPPRDEVPLSLDAGLAALRQQATAQAAAEARTADVARWLGVLSLVLLYRAVIALAALNAAGATGGVAGWYTRLARWGRRLGCPPGAADTPREYAAALAEAATCAAQRARRRDRATEAAAVVREEAMALAQAFEGAVYGAGVVPASASGKSRPQTMAGDRRRWDKLWKALRQLWWARFW